MTTLQNEKELDDTELQQSQELENDKHYKEEKQESQENDEQHFFSNNNDADESSALEQNSISTLEESEENLEERRGRESYYYACSDNCEKHLMQKVSESTNSSFVANMEKLRNTETDWESETSEYVNVQSDNDANSKNKCEEGNVNNYNNTNDEFVTSNNSRLSCNEICSKLLEIRLRLQHTLHTLERMELQLSQDAITNVK